MRVHYWLLTLRAWWRELRGKTRTHEFPFPRVFQIQVQRLKAWPKGFSFWITDDETSPRPGDTLSVSTDNFGMLDLLVITAKLTDRHGVYGVAVPSRWSEQAVMEFAWRDFQRQAEREVQTLRQAVWALVATHGGTSELDYSYFRSTEPVEVEFIPGGEKVFVKVVAGEGAEKVTHG